jgi:hypothetical protein
MQKYCPNFFYLINSQAIFFSYLRYEVATNFIFVTYPQINLGVIHGKRLRRFEVVRIGTLRVIVRPEPNIRVKKGKGEVCNMLIICLIQFRHCELTEATGAQWEYGTPTMRKITPREVQNTIPLITTPYTIQPSFFAPLADRQTCELTQEGRMLQRKN